ncbi:MAG: NADH:flavin oxidoreductase [Desulfobacteraceae bacterium]|nr:MAG: NADH:flavin oxidoreductase [Desulfobacteraceae bacterium]
MTLFDPLPLKGISFKNRIIMPAMQLRLGLGNPRARAFYLERARGGAGAIILAGTSVDLLVEDAAWGQAGGVNRLIERMQAFTADIRQAGSRVGIQLWHGNQLPAGNGGMLPGAEQVAPSASGDRRDLRVSEIELIIAKFARAASTAQAAGFDFVQVHGAHGYLVCQFFSGADNRRTDRYGGDLHGRMRFGLETVAAMRAAVGPQYPIFYRIGAEENRPGGITLPQSRLFAAALQGAGVDAFDVSIGMPVGRRPSPGPRARMGTFVHLAAGIKQTVTVPVMAVGRINRSDLAEAFLSEGKADLVGVGRQLIADPQWPEKMRTGKEGTIVACTSCNSCFAPLRSGKWKPGDPICKVNPRAGREMDGC